MRTAAISCAKQNLPVNTVHFSLMNVLYKQAAVLADASVSALSAELVGRAQHLAQRFQLLAKVAKEFADMMCLVQVHRAD